MSSCSQFQAFEDRRREPRTEKIYIGESTPKNPVICYNSLFYSIEKITLMADKLCQDYQTGTKAKFLEESSFSCRLFIPSSAKFVCEN